MDNKTHALSGGLVGLLLAFWLVYVGLDAGFFFWANVALTVFAAVLPDAIEPPTSYLHRAFFHSWGFLVLMLLLLAIGFVIGYDYGYFFLFFFALGYIIHLLEDATTTMGLPRI